MLRGCQLSGSEWGRRNQGCFGGCVFGPIFSNRVLISRSSTNGSGGRGPGGLRAWLLAFPSDLLLVADD